jgi:pyrroloquinoline quinone biosynthesis protein B
VRVRLLGTAAGGGFPQWNCACPNCDGVRRGTIRARPRHECCAAVSADGRRWFLLNAPPDVRAGVESFPPLLPAGHAPGALRGSAVEGVLLTGADLDQVLGLLTLREGPRLAVHATAAVRRSLAEGLALPTALEAYAGATWREPPEAEAPLTCRDGAPSGLRYSAFLLPGRPPRYLHGRAAPAPGDCVGYVLVDEASGGRLAVAPGLPALDGETLGLLGSCDAVLVDGTFWTDDELRRCGVGDRSAGEMGHVPVGGPDGSLALLGPLANSTRRRCRTIYVHINNTNPMLVEDSPEQQAVVQAGVEVGRDGLELEL